MFLSIKKSLPYLLLSCIFLIYWISYLYVSLSIPVDGDGALHAGTVKVMAKVGELIEHHPYTITDGTSLLPIFYPKLFYTEMTTLFLFFGNVTFQAIVPTFGVFVGVFIFLITRWLFKSFTVATVSSLIVLSSFGLITNSIEMFRMETMVVFLVLGSIYCLLRFTEMKHFGWFFCSVLFLGACLATKQQTYIYLPIFLLIIFTKVDSRFKNKILLTISFYFISFLIAAPVLVKEFISTGTLFYPGIPLVGGIEKHIANFFNVPLYSVGEGWVKYGIGSDRIIRLKVEYSSAYNHLLFLNPFYISPSDLNVTSLMSYFYIPLLIAGSILAILRRHYFIVIFLILQQVLLFIQPIERYFLLNQVLSSVIIGCSIGFLELSRVRVSISSKIVLISIIIVFSITSAARLLSESITIPNYSWGSYVPGRIAAEEKAGEWLKDNSSEDSIIITPRTHVFSYYSERRALWVNQLGGKDIYEAFLNNNVESIYKIAKSYKSSYIIIPEYWIAKGEADGAWISFIERNTVNKIQAKPEYFKKVYSSDVIKIYKTI